MTRQKLSQRPTPGLAHAASLQHHVIDSHFSEFVAHCESGLAGTDDDDIRLAHLVEC